MKSSPRAAPARERGATLLWVAGMLVALLGASAFAVDLGWMYLNASRLQKAADSAALAGVVNLPAFPDQAEVDAGSAAAANDFPIGGVNSMVVTQLPDEKLQVALSTQVPAFFTTVLGFETFDITRTSTGQYIQPVPIGSPANCFGIGNVNILNDSSLPSSTQTAEGVCDNYTQNFWAAIQGPYTAFEHGDPFATHCLTASSSGCSGANPTPHRPGGYYYAIEASSDMDWLDVWIYDAGFYRRTGGGGGCDWSQTGDCDLLGNSDDGGAHTTFTLRAPDNTPYNPADNPVIGGSCTLTVNTESNASTYRNNWVRPCRINNPDDGSYILQVTTSGNHGGSNHYALMANASNISSTNFPRIYGVNDMSIFTNEVDGSATVWLVEVLPVHAGKKLNLTFFDPGEADPPATMSVLLPSGSVASNCSWTSDNGSSGSSCSITTSSSGSGSIFNGDWIDMIIDIPSGYTCTASANNGSGCYWKMNLDLNDAHDRTTWTARIIGNPVRLIENQP